MVEGEVNRRYIESSNETFKAIILIIHLTYLSASPLRIVFWILPKTKIHKDVKTPNNMTRIPKRKQMRVRKWRISRNNHLSRFNHKIFNLQYLNSYLQRYLFCLFLLFKYSKIIINNKKQWLVCGFALSDELFVHLLLHIGFFLLLFLSL